MTKEYSKKTIICQYTRARVEYVQLITLFCMHTQRTRLGKDIIAEFIVPMKPSSKVMIFCDGMPGAPGKKKALMQRMAKKGYWCFNPRYRGSWESGGEFLKDEPTKDILDVMNTIETEHFFGLWDKQEYRIVQPEFYLIGGSFGGPAVLLLSKDRRVKKVIALSPVVDWTAPSETESLDMFGPFIIDAFGVGYRMTLENWNKLSNGVFYNPIAQQEKIAKEKILLIHAKDDDVVCATSVEQFVRETGVRLCMYTKGGHRSTGFFDKWGVMWKVMHFLNS